MATLSTDPVVRIGNRFYSGFSAANKAFSSVNASLLFNFTFLEWYCGDGDVVKGVCACVYICVCYSVKTSVSKLM